MNAASMLPFEGSVDALTIGIASQEAVRSSTDDDEENELESVYKTIRENKANASMNMEMNMDAGKEK